jgi:type IV secretion system protein VirD4
MLILGRHSFVNSRQIGFCARAKKRRKGDLITYNGDGHLITFAPTGTGKTSGPVITNALRHPGQLLVLDIKGEVYEATASARRVMGPVHVLDLRDDGIQGSLNPLDLAVRTGTESAAIARAFAAELIERSDYERDRFWSDWSETVISGGVCWALKDLPAAERRMSKLFDLFHTGDVAYAIAVLLDRKENAVNQKSRAVWSAFLELPEKETRPSVVGTVQSHLRLFDSDLARRLTDTTTIDLDALLAGKPMSLYLIVPPYRLEAYRPLLRLWLSGLLQLVSLRKKAPKNRTLLLCDEIGNLGRINAFITAATLMRSAGLSIWSFWQNPDQMQIYKPQVNTLIDNAGVIQCFGARNRRMAQDFADLVGGVDADAILNLGPREQLLLIEGGKPVRCAQARYYEDAAFKGR